MRILSFYFLTVVFAAAKLIGWIDWSWWLVCAPLILAMALLGFTTFFDQGEDE